MFKPGDKVLWTDPTDDVECDCSKEFVLTKVYDKGEFLHVLGIGAYEDGTKMEVDLQCYENELSLVTKDKFHSFDGTNQSWCEDAGWVEHKEEKKMYRCKKCKAMFNPADDFLEDADAVEALEYFVDDPLCGGCSYDITQLIKSIVNGYIKEN